MGVNLASQQNQHSELITEKLKKRRNNSPFLKVVGNAATARTTTSKEKKSVTDARKTRIQTTSMQSLNTAALTLRQKKPSESKEEHLADQMIAKRSSWKTTRRTTKIKIIFPLTDSDLETGLATNARTSTTLLETLATSATWPNSKATIAEVSLSNRIPTSWTCTTCRTRFLNQYNSSNSSSNTCTNNVNLPSQCHNTIQMYYNSSSSNNSLPNSECMVQKIGLKYYS